MCERIIRSFFLSAVKRGHAAQIIRVQSPSPQGSVIRKVLPSSTVTRPDEQPKQIATVYKSDGQVFSQPQKILLVEPKQQVAPVSRYFAV